MSTTLSDRDLSQLESLASRMAFKHDAWLITAALDEIRDLRAATERLDDLVASYKAKQETDDLAYAAMCDEARRVQELFDLTWNDANGYSSLRMCLRCRKEYPEWNVSSHATCPQCLRAQLLQEKQYAQEP